MARALLVGASGLVGSHCRRLLLADPDWTEVIAFVRRPPETAHPRYHEVSVDFSRLDATEIDCPETVFCCLGTTLKKAGSLEAQRKVDVDYVVDTARWALARGAKHFLVVSSIGADRRSNSAYLRMKGEMEAAVRALGYPVADVLRPSVLLGERPDFRLAESLGQKLLLLVDPLLHFLMPKYRAIAAEKVARAMVALAEDPQPGFHVHESDAIPRIGEP